MTRLFLSYARNDEGESFDPTTSFVARLHRDLIAAGFDVWFDRVSMPSRSLTFHQEIRDAVAACDRLVLVVGPKAAESLYVRQEWQFAYFEAEKIVTPILRYGDYPYVPDELKLLHCEDFRDDGQYDFHLKNLIRQLAELAPPLGKLIGVPSLPPHFLSRTDRLTALRDALRADLDRPVVITGAAARVGMHGMGGIGKSVLAATLSRDRKVREAFPDGIVWVGLGPLPTVADLQRRVHKDLGGDGAFQTEHEGRAKLRDILKDKGVLLILDDVWRRADVDWFDVLGPRCRAMITTRDAGLLTSLGGVHHQVELLTDAEALNLLAQAAGVERDKLPSEADDLIAKCGRLPLAVALCGGLIRHGFAWAKVLEQLRTSRIDRINDPHAIKVEHENIWNAIDVSVKFLSADEQARFLELAVFPSDESTPIAAVRTLWSHTAGFDDWDTDALVIKLSQRSLLELTLSAEGKSISLHDLVYDYVHRAAGDEKALHQRLLDAYRRTCPDGWHVNPLNDGYFFTHLRHHLIAAGRVGELADLLHELRWLEAKNEAGLTFDLTEDFSNALGSLPADDSRRKILRLLDEALRRDLHFISRHSQDYPQALFQCLWNTAWWFDCSEAAFHYIMPRGGWLNGRPPWDQTGEKLSALLERWCDEKARATPGFHWVRCLRPPIMHLGTARIAIFGGHEAPVMSVSYSSEGRLIASASQDKTVRVWDSRSGAQLAACHGHEDQVSSISFSPHDLRIASASADSTVRIWDAQRGQELAVLRGHLAPVTSVSYSPDGRLIASGSKDKTVRVWNANGAELLWTAEHQNEVTCVAWSPNGRYVASGSKDSVVRFWDSVEGTESTELDCNPLVLEVNNPLGKGVNRLSWSPDGHLLAVVSGSSTVMIWDRSRATVLQKLHWMSGRPSSSGICWSPNSRFLALWNGNENVRIWDAAATTKGDLCLDEHYGYDEEESDYYSSIRVEDEDEVNSASWSYGGDLLALGLRNGTVQVWEAHRSTEPLRHMRTCWATIRGHRFRGPDRLGVGNANWSPDGVMFVKGEWDKTVQVWDTRDGAELFCLRGNAGTVNSVNWSPDGRTLVSGSADWTIRVWDSGRERPVLRWYGAGERFMMISWAPSGKELAVLRGHDAGVYSVLYSADGQRIVSRSWDKTIRVWDAKTYACLEVIPNCEDATAVDAGVPIIAWRALAQDRETVIEDAVTGQIIARFPVAIYEIVAHPEYPQWWGNTGYHFYIIKLEGNLPSAS